MHREFVQFTCVGPVVLIDCNRRSQASYMTIEPLPTRFDDAVSEAKLWMQNRIQQKIDLKELSSHLGISHRTLIRKFKTSTGETPIKYLQKIRIETIKHLLETTELKLESIIERVGYSDISSFSVLFKRITQLTPREYRQQFSIRHRIKDHQTAQ